MAEDQLDPGLEDDAFGPARKSGPSMVVLLLCAALGAGAGGWFGGPLVTPMIAQVAAGGGEGGGDDGHGGGGDSYGGGGYGGGEAEDGPLTIENLVLNPAGSGASRFLIATLVLETDNDARAELEARDAEARDLLLTVLSSMTVEELTDISQRNVIRETLRSALNDMLAREGVYRIFLPQFVIQ